MIAPYIRPLALVAMLAAAPVAAQDTATDDSAAADALPVGEEVGGPGSTYVAETHGDWEIQCERTEDGSDPCVMNQLMKNAEGGSMAEINLFALPEAAGDAIAGATIITPLETLLTKNITLQVGSRQPKRYQFTFCTQIGCVARVGFTAEDIDAFRKGAEATVTVFAIAAPNQPFNAIMSLSGFTAAYDALQAMNN
ncbi:MAG: invasion associated locus B family protein [Rhodobacteraceae bacterium]|nr:invasion associated locus B family protein [Paracoccaceae bacterium]